MKIKTTLLILSIFTYNLLLSQIKVEIKNPEQKPCVDSVIQFVAVVTDLANDTIKDASLTWSFGDGTATETSFGTDTIEHTFTKGGGHIIRLDASKGTDSDYALFKYEVALTPNFSETVSNREEPICLGQQILLTGIIIDSTWVYEVPDKNEEESAVEISDTKTYNSIFDYRIFTESQTITDALDIDSIGINLEHSNLNNVKIEISCPNDTSIILKDFGGADGKYFGAPNISNPNQPGTGFDYFWTNTPDNGTMNSVTPIGDALPSGSYTPEEGFNLLIGCPLNGEWTIKTTDNQANDSGFVFLNQLTFEASLLPADWEYSHTYGFPEWIGLRVTSTSGAGLATAVPDLHGNHKYTFKVKDNFGCYQDTSLLQNVEPVSFTADPLEGDFDLPVQFTPNTSWATEYEWDFGDETDFSIEEAPNHTYEKDGLFRAYLTAITDDGCSDTLSVLVTVTIPPSSLDNIPNVFSPNGDGQNDIFKLQEGAAIKTLEGFIYSRWGKKVAEWHSVEEATNIGWDGRINEGQEAAPGVYYYVINAIGYDGKEYKEYGSFHLFR